MGIVRVMALGVPIPHEAWKPIVRVCADGVRQEDIYMQALHSAKDLHMVQTKCDDMATLTFQLGLKKTDAFWHLDTHTHTAQISHDCLVLIEWGQETQITNTKVKHQYALFVNEAICGKCRVCGNRRELGQWRPEQTLNQVSLYSEDMCITPIALEETESNLVEFKLLKDEGGTLSWEEPPFYNKSFPLTHKSDVVVLNTWSQKDVIVTAIRHAALIEETKQAPVPAPVPLPVARPTQQQQERDRTIPPKRVKSSPGLTTPQESTPHTTQLPQQISDAPRPAKSKSATDNSVAVLELACAGDAAGKMQHPQPRVVREESFVDISWVFQEDEKPLSKSRHKPWPMLKKRAERAVSVFKCCTARLPVEEC